MALHTHTFAFFLIVFVNWYIDHWYKAYLPLNFIIVPKIPDAMIFSITLKQSA